MPVEWQRNRWDIAANLGHGLSLSVSYEGVKRLPQGVPGYNVYVFGRRLNARAEDEDAGKKRAEEAAKAWLESALSKLTS